MRTDPKQFLRFLFPLLIVNAYRFHGFAIFASSTDPGLSRENGANAHYHPMQRPRPRRRQLCRRGPKIAAEVAMPDGYRLEWGGQFENMHAQKRLMLVVLTRYC
jgi:hypothetical protein